MSPGWISVLAAVVVASAGCVAPAASDGSQPTNAATAAGAGRASPSGGTQALAAPPDPAGPVPMYLDTSLALGAAPPAQEGRVTLPTPVNSPYTFDYPVWNGTLPRTLNLTGATIPVVFYVATSSATVAANQLPTFTDLPRFFVSLTLGDVTLEGEADGPATMHVGHVATIEVELQGRGGGLVAAGAPVSFAAAPLYTHVEGAAEFQYVMGPEHPAHVLLGAA